jgi:hypothetical protein
MVAGQHVNASCVLRSDTPREFVVGSGRGRFAPRLLPRRVLPPRFFLRHPVGPSCATARTRSGGRSCLGIDPHKVMASPIGRTVKLSEGSVVPALLA